MEFVNSVFLKKKYCIVWQELLFAEFVLKNWILRGVAVFLSCHFHWNYLLFSPFPSALRDNSFDYLEFRLWIGLWSGLFCLVLVATDASFLVQYFTRFTEEGFSALISFIFIYDAFKKMIKLAHHNPINPEFDHNLITQYDCRCVPGAYPAAWQSKPLGCPGRRGTDWCCWICHGVGLVCYLHVCVGNNKWHPCLSFPSSISDLNWQRATQLTSKAFPLHWLDIIVPFFFFLSR